MLLVKRCRFLAATAVDLEHPRRTHFQLLEEHTEEINKIKGKRVGGEVK